eukprot:comp20517_c1_seq1/m.26272 comp20517_c1_seq1/g.26272  ORF comp20517_c1_seq1/g.26272 comp20517_c1_seq1/m.26272 type:complete len:139 (+) comp20517_c1_seq1:39-455(+)
MLIGGGPPCACTTCMARLVTCQHTDQHPSPCLQAQNTQGPYNDIMQCTHIQSAVHPPPHKTIRMGMGPPGCTMALAATATPGPACPHTSLAPAHSLSDWGTIKNEQDNASETGHKREPGHAIEKGVEKRIQKQGEQRR